MAALLTVGTVDLSPYLRVNPGDGFQPGGQGQFLEPGFSDNSFGGEGQPLLSVTARNREIQAPLFANTSTKDLLHDLVRDLNRELRPGATVVWQDDGATQATYFTLAFGRLEEDYNYRRAAAGYLGVTVHLWVSPFGTTGTQRLLSFVAGSGLLITASLAALDGDVPADALFAVGGLDSTDQRGRLVVVAPLPHPSYLTDVPAASLGLFGAASLVGASGAPGSQLVRMTEGGETRFRLPIPSVHAGANRVLVIARPLSVPGMAFTLFHPEGYAVGPTMVASGDGKGWLTYDAGVLRVPSIYPGPSAYDLALRSGMPSLVAAGTSGYVDTSLNLASYTPGGMLDVGRVLVLPDEQACFVKDTDRPLAGFVSAGATKSLAAANTIDLFGNPMGTLGFLPTNYPGYANAEVADAMGAPYRGIQISATSNLVGVQIQHEAVRNAAAYADMSWDDSDSYVEMAAVRLTDPYRRAFIEGRFYHSAAFGAQFVDLTVYRTTPPATRMLLASLGLRATQPIWRGRLGLEARGPRVTFTMRPKTADGVLYNAGGGALPVASIGASQGWLTGPKQAGFVAFTDNWQMLNNELSAYEVGATGPLPGDVYRLDGAGVRRAATGGDVTAVLAPARGAVPKLAAPTTAAVAFGLLPIGQPGPAGQALSAAVWATERFRYAR